MSLSLSLLLTCIPYESSDIKRSHGQKVDFGNGFALMRWNEPPVERFVFALSPHRHFQVDVAATAEHF